MNLNEANSKEATLISYLLLHNISKSGSYEIMNRTFLNLNINTTIYRGYSIKATFVDFDKNWTLCLYDTFENNEHNFNGSFLDMSSKEYGTFAPNLKDMLTANRYFRNALFRYCFPNDTKDSIDREINQILKDL